MQLHETKNTLRSGVPYSRARGVVILVHGRGSSASDIAVLSEIFNASDLAYLAPEATNNAWYPHRFLVPPAQNEPWLSSALGVIDTLVADVLASGMPSHRIALVGFSQGACLVLEYVFRHPRRYAFVAALSGALIGPTDAARDEADLQDTPVLIGCAEQDAHIPIEYVEHSAMILGARKADVTTQVFPGSAHTVFPAEAVWLIKQGAAITKS